MFKATVALVALFFLTACDPFEGLLSVKYPMTVKSTEKNAACSPDDQWLCNTVVDVVVPVGDQNAKLEFTSKYNIELNLNIDGNRRRLNLESPKKLSVPSDGDFFISSKDLGQIFAAKGNSITRITNSEVIRGNESCTYQRPQQVCYPNGAGQVICHIEYVTAYGYQQVEYYNKNTNQKIAVSFVDERNNGLYADYNGERNFSEKVYTYKGQCF